MDQPKWLAAAWAELGQREVSGPATNPRIRQFFADAGHPAVEHDEVAWCAAFLGACLERSGIASTQSLLARSYLDWGLGLDEARLGAVAVLSRGPDPALGHVGFIVGETGAHLVLLGGNQSGAVTVEAFEQSRLLGLRWPTETAPERSASGFEPALAHVLQMEGGYTDDPYDPGGPTNRGITLKVFAAWTGTDVNSASVAQIKEGLKRIPQETVRQIYLMRYWRPARCPDLPAPIALMHFDAAVNHGVSAASRMLQEAAGAVIDGEIGPETLAAVAAKDIPTMLRDYAGLRRRRYRALAHFWRFGRGWLSRVEKTLFRAEAIAESASQPSTSAQKGPTPMANVPAAPVDQTPTKWWGNSVTIWGALITALSTVLPALGPVIGVDISGELVRQAGEQIVTTVQGIGGLIGTILTIYGRMRASQPLERREVSLKV